MSFVTTLRRDLSFICLFSISTILALFSLAHTSSLDAGGWGKTDEVVIYEEMSWNGVYFDMNGLNFSALIPNYSGTTLANGSVAIRGDVGKNSGYLISTSFSPAFNPPASAQEFTRIVQEANPDYLVIAIDSTKLGAKYAVDMVPSDSKNNVYWRFLCTNDRLVRMGVDDANENRRFNFFESIYIR